MDRSERHKHKESRESIGDEAVEHTGMIGTCSTDKQVKKFAFTGRVR